MPDVVQEPAVIATYPQHAPAPPMSEKPAAPAPQPIAAAIPPPSPAPLPATPPGENRGARRIGKNLLDEIKNEISRAASQPDEKKPLTDEFAHQLFEQYRQQLQATGKSVLHAQFGMIRLEVRSPDELKLISPNNLTDTYAREQRNLLIDYFRSETKMNIRITTEVQIDEALEASQVRVLSKSEMFEAMAQKNYQLARLREALNMQIEF